MKFNFREILNKLGINKNNKKDGLLMQIPNDGQQNQLPPPLAVPKSNQQAPQQPMYRTAPGQQIPPQPNNMVTPMVQGSQYDTFNPDVESKGKKGFSIDSFVPAGAAVGVCILLLLMGVFSPTLNNYRSDITRLETDLVSMRKADTSIEAKAEDAVGNANKFDGRITAIEKQNTELVSSVKALPSMNDVTKATSQYDGKIATLTTTINEMNTKFGKMETEVNGLKAQIALLEEQTNTPSDISSGKVITSINREPSELSIPIDATGEYIVNFKAEIKNGLNKEITNVELLVNLIQESSRDGYLPKQANGYPKLFVNNSIELDVYDISNRYDYIEFDNYYNRTKISVPPMDTTSLYFKFITKPEVKTVEEVTIQYEADITIDDYDIVGS